MSALDKVRQGVVALSERAQRHETGKLLRRAVLTVGAFAHRRGDAARTLEGLQATMDLHVEETSSWVAHGALARGEGGPFDACDLRHWLALAERAGVPAVPAVEVVALSDVDMSLATAMGPLPDIPSVRAMRRRIDAVPELEGARRALEAEPPPDPEAEALAREGLEERLAAAMDGVPEGWMVRYARCGGSNLKALAGMGVSGPTVPEVRFGPNLEIGPGWVRRGNRRAVAPADNRTVEAAGQGPGEPHAFLARPWVPAARWAVGEDPHRHGTAYAGKGRWPAEWRAFVEDGRVVGVSSYYGWCGSADPENAGMALRVRDLAQRIADEAVRQRAFPRYMDVEFVRASGHPSVTGDPRLVSVLETFGRERVGCTLDFIEVETTGPVLLEGGPPNTPFGGGHPCAFAGAGGQPRGGTKTQTVGVAFRTMPHVSLAEPSTWTDGAREGCILTWEETLALARASNPAASGTGPGGGAGPVA